MFADPQIAVIGGGIKITSRNYWILSDNLSMFYEYLADHPRGLREQLPSLNLAIRKSAFNHVRGFDDRYPRASGEDADLTFRLRHSGYLLYFEPSAIVHHLPARNNLLAILRHGYYQGKYSTKVDRRYSGTTPINRLSTNRIFLILFSPLLAIAVLVRMFYRYPATRKYLASFPAVYLSKIAWCFGAASHPDWTQ
jgi:GT2 family glycosyltransferase